MKYVNTFAIFLMGSLLSGCVLLSTFQGPYGLNQGETAFGIGVSGLGVSTTDEESTGGFGLPEVQLQHGVSDRFQVGARLGLGTLGLDARYRVVSGEKLGVAIGGTGTLALGGLTFSESEEEVFVVGSAIPYVSVGTPRIWGGLRGFGFFAGNSTDVEVADLGPGVFIGGELGRGRLRFIPELAIHSNREGGGNFTTFGILMRYKFPR
ncbi:MAG: hypothetical protein J0L94_14760 [Rhodothermia bacterium]|nr:hypothetical protein [Rhodothermia bacterium]